MSSSTKHFSTTDVDPDIDRGSSEFLWHYTDGLNDHPEVRRWVERYAAATAALYDPESDLTESECWAEQDRCIDALYDVVLLRLQIGEWLRLTGEEGKVERGSILFQNEDGREGYVTVTPSGISSW
jgi:hypothetical protein